MSKIMMYVVRLVAAFVIATWMAPGLLAPQPVRADGTCAPGGENQACYTTNDFYVGEYCESGVGTDCITCTESTKRCTWSGGGEDHYGWEDDSSV